MELEASLTLEERLEKQRWYLGEMSQDVAESLLSSSDLSNSFVVYTLPETRQYTLSARFKVEGVEEGVIEHLAIHCTEEGRYCISGQTDKYADLIEAVNTYVLTSDPPLVPALRGRSFETQVSITDAPPEYDKANRVLKPDIAPLPDIGKIKVADKTAVEATSGRISPTNSGSFSHQPPVGNWRSRRRQPSYLDRSIWVRYDEHHRCHPKNVCSGCCYRPEEWTGYGVEHSHKWYNPCGSGPLRFIGLILFWMLCAPCFGCVKCCGILCYFCMAICCGLYDSS